MSFKGQFVAPNIEVYFGDKNDKSNFNNECCKLKQVHSNIVVDANKNISEEADAQYTKSAGLKLCIYTADCMPIMMTDGETIAAIHAGWKGLFSNIISNVVKQCFDRPDRVGAFIGPHIHLKSFEFSKNDLKQYIKTYTPLSKASGAIVESSKNKVNIDLKLLAQYELQSLGISLINQLNINTFTSEVHHSYRRDGKNSGRNLSWIKITN